MSIRSSVRFCTSSEKADLPSILTFGSSPSTSNTVGRMSIVETQASSVLPRFWPGALISNGTGAISAAVSRPSRLRSRRRGKATPWSAATTISDLS